MFWYTFQNMSERTFPGDTPRGHEGLGIRLDEHVAKTKMAAELSKTTAEAALSISESYHTVMGRWVVASDRLARVGTDLTWLYALQQAGVSADTILTAWDIKDQKERELPRLPLPPENPQ